MSPIRATVVIHGGSVTLLPRRAPVGRSLAIFAGQPPAPLLARSPRPFRATIEPGTQPGFAIVDLDEHDAAALGQTLGLAEILFWDGRRARLVPCDAQIV